ncbi:hypothetical protein SAMN05892883_4004 [Jatrophihabitans sp. GAS493]|uniref:hypothetical protein n=1 Tax=Jatrophihabitans sp. GAS493 TaxID=1907575 RepID=UPI000BB7EE75|nr:hypothetical protein [Jatrophihabitans sp. GAS493]SOD74812.1 hypothetical protein SAMN05892883_4004 [Jatrophihabitans sp. GAS493]
MKKRLSASYAALLAVVAALLVALSYSPVPAQASTVDLAVGQASRYGTASGLRNAIAVYDRASGTYWGAGDTERVYGSASVMKVFIATYLLLSGQMKGTVAAQAYDMIVRSNDADATALWPRALGTRLEPWIARHYGISDLGSPNTRAGTWGNTHITAHGMVLFYAAVKADPKVAPWLLNAMRHAQPVAADGTHQFFGIPSATSSYAVKQGWADGSADRARTTTVNTTGFVGSDRYIVVVLSEAAANGSVNAQGLNTAQAAVVTRMAQMVMPNGAIDNPLSHDPVGSFDASTVSHDQVSLAGWAEDPDAPSTSIRVDVYSDGKGIASLTTNVNRPDVNRAFGITGTHGFQTTVALPNGTHSVCIYAINVSSGTGNSMLNCRTVVVRTAPIGSLDQVQVVGNTNQVHIAGWAYDPDASDASSSVAVYVDGKGVDLSVPTTFPRPDVNAHYAITGLHGFDLTVTLPDGTHSVCVYALNVGAGSGNPGLGCQPVAIHMRVPIGSLDIAQVLGRTGLVSLRGWALDPDAPTSVSQVAAYDDNAGAPAYGLTTTLRTDVNRVYATSGTHGYDLSVPIPAGVHRVCVYAINIGAATGNPAIGCATVNVPAAAPVGAFDTVTALGTDGTVQISGWAFDPDLPASSVQIAAYDGSHGIGWLPATSVTRSDVNRIYGITGAHGFVDTLNLAPGSHSVCLYAINIGAARANTFLGCRPVSVAAPGAVTAVPAVPRETAPIAPVSASPNPSPTSTAPTPTPTVTPVPADRPVVTPTPVTGAATSTAATSTG